MQIGEAVAGAVESPVPSPHDLLERARELRPVFKERAFETEASRRVSTSSMELLREAGLLKVTKPRQFGGFGYNPSTLVRLGFELGQACGSTAWCGALANANSWFLSYWPIEAQNDVWGEVPDNLVAGTVAPTAKSEPADGGYTIQGRWPYLSNCDNSEWLFVSCFLPDPEPGLLGAALFLVPKSALRMDESSWHVSGLQGSGSKTMYSDEPVFVPAHRVLRFKDIAARNTPGQAIPGNNLASFNFTTFGASALIGQILGMAQGGLDWFAETMVAKSKGPMKPMFNPHIQSIGGEASAYIDGAFSLLLGDLEAAEARVASNGSLTVAERLRIRRNFGFAAQQSVKAVNRIFEVSGSSSSEVTVPIQRIWRDVNAAARHISLDAYQVNMLYGQEMFGLEPSGQF